jgi:hypothetical protein
MNCAGLGNQSCNVVLVKGAFILGGPQGFRISEWETDGEQMGRDGYEEISLQATWDQGGRILSQQGGFQVSKRGQERKQKGISKGRQKARGSANIYSKAKRVYKDCA